MALFRFGVKGIANCRRVGVNYARGLDINLQVLKLLPGYARNIGRHDILMYIMHKYRVFAWVTTCIIDFKPNDTHTGT